MLGIEGAAPLRARLPRRAGILEGDRDGAAGGVFGSRDSDGYAFGGCGAGGEAHQAAFVGEAVLPCGVFGGGGAAAGDAQMFDRLRGSLVSMRIWPGWRQRVTGPTVSRTCKVRILAQSVALWKAVVVAN